MATRTRQTAALIVGMLLLLAGCSSSPGASASAGAAAAGSGGTRNSAAASCALLTLAEAETAFGQTFLAPNGTDGEPGHCEYFNQNGFGLQVEIAHGPSVAATLDADKAKAGAGAADLPGVGDKAFESLQGRRLIEFVKADQLVTLYSASRIDPDTFRGLAKAAAARMP